MNGLADHPWFNGLFADPDTATLWAPAQQLTHMLAFEAAYTRALGHVGRVPSEDAARISRQIEAFEPDMDGLSIGTAQDGVVVPAMVVQLRAGIDADPAAIHTGATSQDAIDTALALTLRDFNIALEVHLDNVSRAFAQLADQFGQRCIMGRTRMQAALSITVADRLASWSQPLEHHRDRLQRVRPIVECLQLGGAVGDRSAMAPHGEKIAALMAKDLRLENPAGAWHAMRDGLVDYANLLSLISGTLGKFGQDICLMAQQGIDEVTLEGGGGSSAMPHKQNPILAELLVTLARFNATQISGMHHSMIHEQERSGSAWGLEWMILPQMAQATARSLSASTEICTQITSLGSA